MLYIPFFRHFAQRFEAADSFFKKSIACAHFINLKKYDLSTVFSDLFYLYFRIFGR